MFEKTENKQKETKVGPFKKSLSSWIRTKDV